jgi:hypothetical protein
MRSVIFGDHAGGWLVCRLGPLLAAVVDLDDREPAERLAELAAVAVQRVGLEQLPGQRGRPP